MIIFYVKCSVNPIPVISVGVDVGDPAVNGASVGDGVGSVVGAGVGLFVGAAVGL